MRRLWMGALALSLCGCGDIVVPLSDGGAPKPDAGVLDDVVDGPDAEPDAGPDAAPEVEPDAEPEIEPDLGPDAGEPLARFSDDFWGTGPLEGYVTRNAHALPEVARVDGRYRAHLQDNSGNVTLHYNGSQGRLDAKLLTFPFDVVARNIGVGTVEDALSAPEPEGETYIFAGLQVHALDLEAPTWAHVVVGHRGDTWYTIEAKTTVGGVSVIGDAGAGSAPDGRADIRIVGNPDRTLTVYWQPPNQAPGTEPDSWVPYNGTGAMPGPEPAFGEQVYVGLITYAYNSAGVPFVGTCDALEGGSL